MTQPASHCLIDIEQLSCGRKGGEPVCAKCGMDERVVYVGEKDWRQARDAALARCKAAEQAEGLPKIAVPPLPPAPPLPPGPKLKPIEPPKKTKEPDISGGGIGKNLSPDKSRSNGLLLLVAVVALVVAGGWFFIQQSQENLKEIRQLLVLSDLQENLKDGPVAEKLARYESLYEQGNLFSGGFKSKCNICSMH